MRRVRGDACLFLAIAMLPVFGILALVSAAVMDLTATGSGADTPSYALSCKAAGIPISLPSVKTEGVLTSNPVSSGATDNLRANSADVPNSAFGLYNASTNPTGVNLLNGPDTGLGVVLQFPATLEPLTTAGDTVAFSGSVPLTVGNGSGTPSLSVNGGFTVPATYPPNAAVVITATQSGTIAAGSSGTLSVTEPQFTTASPLNLTITLGTTHIPITCTSTGVETVDTATITGGSTGSTTTTTTAAKSTSTTTTTSSPTKSPTNTTAVCDAKPTTSTGPPSLTADPGTCLSGGTVVSVTGSGFHPNSSGVIYECNDAPGQPTVNVGAPLNRAVPVGCSGILPSTTVTTTATGTFTVNFTIILGMTGPPCGSSYPVSCPTTDSAGSNPLDDATKYPCPPTPEQLAAGVSCQLAFGDAGGSSQTVNISFTSDSPPSATPTAASGSTASTAGTAGASSAHTAANTLAFTGPGPDLWMLAIGGILLIDLGFLVLTIYYRPRQLFAIAGRKVHRILGGT